MKSQETGAKNSQTAKAGPFHKGQPQSPELPILSAVLRDRHRSEVCRWLPCHRSGHGDRLSGSSPKEPQLTSGRDEERAPRLGA